LLPRYIRSPITSEPQQRLLLVQSRHPVSA
jgi:hypothetical protein